MAEKKEPKYPGYSAVLPPQVRYDQGLRPSAKLLYAEIYAMADVLLEQRRKKRLDR